MDSRISSSKSKVNGVDFYRNPNMTCLKAGMNQNDDLPTNPVVHRDNIIPENDGTARFEHAQHRHIHEQQIQKKQVDQEHLLGRHHDNINSRSGPEKDGGSHLNGVDRHVQEHRQESEDFSGDGKLRALFWTYTLLLLFIFKNMRPYTAFKVTTQLNFHLDD